MAKYKVNYFKQFRDASQVNLSIEGDDMVDIEAGRGVFNEIALKQSAHIETCIETEAREVIKNADGIAQRLHERNETLKERVNALQNEARKSVEIKDMINKAEAMAPNLE